MFDPETCPPIMAEYRAHIIRRFETGEARSGFEQVAKEVKIGWLK